jgi:hypothetical protein
VIHDGERLEESVSDHALADDRDVGVLVDRSHQRHEEEARREVLHVVDREDVEAPAVHAQLPARQVPCVLEEEAVRLVGRGLDVAPTVADDEVVAVEDAD